MTMSGNCFQKTDINARREMRNTRKDEKRLYCAFFALLLMLSVLTPGGARAEAARSITLPFVSLTPSTGQVNSFNKALFSHSAWSAGAIRSKPAYAIFIASPLLLYRIKTAKGKI